MSILRRMLSEYICSLNEEDVAPEQENEAPEEQREE